MIMLHRKISLTALSGHRFFNFRLTIEWNTRDLQRDMTAETLSDGRTASTSSNADPADTRVADPALSNKKLELSFC
ncbi:MAG: hypothetical protein R2681_02035 [Pyrinomonadaceae bacterium]